MMIETKIIHSSDPEVHCVGTLSTPPRLCPAGIIFLGPPGAGKGTQARYVANEYNLPHISTGDVFRSHVAKKTVLGLQAAEFMRLGMLVPDEVVCAMLTEHVRSLGSASSLILDGFPRSVVQAKWLDRFLHVRADESHDLPHEAPVAIQINIPSNELLRRLAGRRSCPSCGRTYNLYFQPPRNSGMCDYDGTKLVMRPDDSEGVVSKRLMVHDQNTSPITEYYRREGRLLEIDGNDTVDAVQTAIVVGLKSCSHLWRHRRQ